MIECWAACLGGCSDKISREHLISRGVFLTDEVVVQGFSWCRHERKTIGLANFTAKILCQKHNSELSEVDNAGLDTVNAFREAFRLLDVRTHLKPRMWRIIRFHVDGAQLERWFLKTIINVAFKGNFSIGSDSQSRGEPSSLLVEIAFGRRRFEPKMGLHLVAEVGEQIVPSDRLRITPLTDMNNILVAALFYFRGHRFLLYLAKEGPFEPLGLVAGDNEAHHLSHLVYHPSAIRFKARNHLSHVVEIAW
jgi:hypothetical protein